MKATKSSDLESTKTNQWDFIGTEYEKKTFFINKTHFENADHNGFTIFLHAKNSDKNGMKHHLNFINPSFKLHRPQCAATKRLSPNLCKKTGCKIKIFKSRYDFVIWHRWKHRLLQK